MSLVGTYDLWAVLKHFVLGKLSADCQKLQLKNFVLSLAGILSNCASSVDNGYELRKCNRLSKFYIRARVLVWHSALCVGFVLFDLYEPLSTLRIS